MSMRQVRVEAPEAARVAEQMAHSHLGRRRGAGPLIGTPSYMAPESIMDPTSVGAAADLYSVGAVA
jgi:serine/threonine protein kinase